jgi:ring-1,2-phenylacetyl-CoA epoxidase subunit PaaD
MVNMIDLKNISVEQVRTILENVVDPEIPVLSVIDLGIIRDIILTKDKIEVIITPTYSGCPAMDMISTNIKMELLSQGFPTVTVKQVLSPAWTTEWMTEKGKQKLKEYGIAPPNHKQQVCNNEWFTPGEAVQCPHCNSYHTRRISEFGSTACKALYQCDDCKEPFDYFKCH